MKIGFVSYPRSGSHWLAYALERISKVKGVRIGNKCEVFKKKPFITEYRNDAILFKSHLEDGVKEEFYKECDALICIVRNYKECIYRRFINSCEIITDSLIKDDIKVKPYTEKDRWGQSFSYLRILKFFDIWDKPKMLVYYEDFIKKPEETLQHIKLFYDSLHIKFDYSCFIENLEQEKQNSIKQYCLEIEDNGSITKGEYDFYHSKKLSLKERVGIDSFIKDVDLDIFEKFLTVYEENSMKKQRA